MWQQKHIPCTSQWDGCMSDQSREMSNGNKMSNSGMFSDDPKWTEIHWLILELS